MLVVIFSGHVLNVTVDQQKVTKVTVSAKFRYAMVNRISLETFVGYEIRFHFHN